MDENRISKSRLKSTQTNSNNFITTSLRDKRKYGTYRLPNRHISYLMRLQASTDYRVNYHLVYQGSDLVNFEKYSGVKIIF